MPPKAQEFREKLASRILVCDGAMGTMLYSKGIFINRCFDELNLSAPDLVRQVHQEYLQAGSEILETNTFGANAYSLAKHGFAEKLADINRAGVKLAREVGGEKVFIAGSVGPLGARIEPLGRISFEEARAAFRRQIEVLLESGVDLVILETFYDLNELREAILAAREAGGAELPVVAQVNLDDDGAMFNGTLPEVFTPQIDEWGADVIGCNCSSGPKIMLDVIEQMLQLTRKPVSAQPNAGLPANVEGRNIYLCSPEYMAQYARRFIWAGVKIVGGCCGTTPEHIKAIKSEVRSLQPSQARLSVTVHSPHAHAKALAPVPLAERSQLGCKIAAGKFVVFVEILPPRGVDASKEVAGSELCRRHGIDAINVPDGPRASARMSAQVTVKLIQEQAGIEGVLHFCCRDRNILSIQSELLGAHALGIRNLICITGDPPRMGTYPDATAVFD
ncbi:MAG: bifunctional homocysteine S-methyltransferase/methylenetetrahydrofolate reductase, partial [Acidobacteria bacterium]|nr:bifunctional homocysteine S-methyltransferase/methylenetetrahydrofolate reductase [Acidobacteriota bacterium]